MVVSGSYILLIEMKKTQEIEIGRLGYLKFFQGIYGYVGSAMNQQLLNRVKRHLKPSYSKKIHWHIDYLLRNSDVEIVKIYLIPSTIKEECLISKLMQNLAKNSVSRFGSSDCDCKSHLFYFGQDFFLLHEL